MRTRGVKGSYYYNIDILAGSAKCESCPIAVKKTTFANMCTLPLHLVHTVAEN